MKRPKNQSNNSQKSVAIVWDSENIPQYDIASDVLKFSNFQGIVEIRKAYSCNWDKKAKNHLEKLGFECIEVEKPGKIKNAVDFQIAIDCFKPIKKNSYPDVIILVTGDCYSRIVQQNLKSENRKLIVLARRGSDCHYLKKEVDEFYYIEELPELVKNLSSEIPSTESFISYEDAVKCLIEAIQTAVNSGKSATVGYIGKLMHENPNFPNYQNVSSIRKPDGTKFSKFSQFLAKAIQEEMIPKVYQSILLANAR